MGVYLFNALFLRLFEKETTHFFPSEGTLLGTSLPRKRCSFFEARRPQVSRAQQSAKTLGLSWANVCVSASRESQHATRCLGVNPRWVLVKHLAARGHLVSAPGEKTWANILAHS